jgi:hypothetical protein
MANRHALRISYGHRPTLATPSKAFFLAAMRISSQTHPVLCGYSATYMRCLCASIRQLCASMRQLCASIRRPSETDPARYAARPGRSETASAEKRQIEHVKIPKKGTFRPKTAPKKFESGWPTRPETWVAAGFSLRLQVDQKPVLPWLVGHYVRRNEGRATVWVEIYPKVFIK